MPTWLISLFFAVGVGAWLYAKLARYNGNANPAANGWMAAVGGAVVFLVFFTFMKFVVGF